MAFRFHVRLLLNILEVVVTMANKLYFPILILLICFSAEIFAYSQDTHEVISTVAFRASILGTLSQQGRLAEIGLSAQRLNGVAADGNYHTRDIQVWVSEGAYDEDCCGRFFQHFFNPITQTGLLGFKSSLEWGLEQNQDIPSQDYSYKDARDYYRGGLTLSNPTTREHFLAKTFYALGHVIHLLQDLAQPQHTRVEPHIPFLQPYRSLYEEWTESLRGNLPYNNYPDIYPGNRQIFDTPEKFWLAGPATPPSGTTPVKGYGDGLAEFSNYNFLTQGHNCNNASFPNPVCDPNQRQTIPEIQDLCNNPNQDPVACSVPALNSSLSGSITFQRTAIFGPSLPSHNGVNDRASTLSIFDPFLEDCNWSDCNMPPVWNLNRFNFRRTHQFLIPQAIGYSVGLLNYFFRGSIDASLDANGNVIVENSSSENMNGTFTLYYDDVNGVRNPVPRASTSLAIQQAGGTGSLGSFTSPTVPTPKEPGKYILMFDGSMGQENKAVVGRIVYLTSLIIKDVSPAGSISQPRPIISATVVGNGVSGDMTTKLWRDGVLLKTQTLPPAGGTVSFDMKIELTEEEEGSGRCGGYGPYRLYMGNHQASITVDYHLTGDTSLREVTKEWSFTANAIISCSPAGAYRWVCNYGNESFDLLLSKLMRSTLLYSASSFVPHPLSRFYVDTVYFGNSYTADCQVCSECATGDQQLSVGQTVFFDYFQVEALSGTANVYGTNVHLTLP